MKILWKSVILIAGISGCNNQDQTLSNESNQQNFEDTIQSNNTSGIKRKYFVDTSYAGFVIGNSEISGKLITDGVFNGGFRDSDYPNLVLYKHPGGVDVVMELIILNSNGLQLINKDTKQKTSLGIYIGMPKSEFLDSCVAKSVNGAFNFDSTQFTIEVSSPDDTHNKLLFTMNAPQYLANYCFENDRIYKMKFGLPLP